MADDRWRRAVLPVVLPARIFVNINRFKSHRSGRLVETWYGDKPCLAFVPYPLPPELELDKRLFTSQSAADLALGELAGLGHTIANPQLLIGPFIRREAVLSSKIEGTQTDIEGLYAYEAGQLLLPGVEPSKANADAQEVLNYVRALEYGLERQETAPISLNLIKELHKLLMTGVNERANPGEFRAVQNWVGGRGRSITSAVFVPPPVREVQVALAEFEKYIQEPDMLPPLIRLALIHYQFEVIHPFIDGNGRVGRLLILLLLVHWKLLPLPLLYLSAFFEKHRQEYYDLLLAVTEQGKWEDWILFFLRGVKEQAEDAIRRAKQLQDLKDSWHRIVEEARALQLIPLVDHLFYSPFITVREAQRVAGVKTYNTAHSYIDKLLNLGIILPLMRAGTVKEFVAPAILHILTKE
jgi:Fic family protein